MKEDLLQFIWQYKLFDHAQLLTVSKLPLEILNPGELNKDSGPDFFNAKIKIVNVDLFMLCRLLLLLLTKKGLKK